MIEEKMILLLRQNKISKWFSGIGQEAISVAVAKSMKNDDYILPMHRNLGIFTGRNIPLRRLFAQWQGKKSGFTNGRDRSFHFGTQEYNLVGMISHLGPQLGVADGIALASKLKGEKGSAVAVFTGDGGTSEGDFHEALNVASVWSLPVIFIIENNGYGLSTPSQEQFKFDSFTVKGPAYNMDAYSVDGNNVLAVYEMMEKILKKVRKEEVPVILECNTFRLRGHEESSGTKYIPKEIMEYWEERDPVQNYEKYLLQEKVLNEEMIDTLRKEYADYINKEVDSVFDEEEIKPDNDFETKSIFAPYEFKKTSPSSNMKELRFVDAINLGLDNLLEKYQDLVIMGQDIGEYGGVFKATLGLLDKYGADRVRNTPLCESAIIGAGLGLSVKGMRAICEMQFADFVSSGFTQVVNNLAKIHYRWGQNANVTLRMPTGAGVGAGPFHSQSNEGWFLKVPGLKVFYPSNPYDAKGLLATAIEDPNPVLFFEHKALYRKGTGIVPIDYFNIEAGKAEIINTGRKASIISYGYGVYWANEIIEKNKLDVDLIDLRTLIPWDKEAVYNSVKKTGKAIILHEDTITLGFGAEISAFIGKELFTYLDAPIYRTGSLDTPVPFAKSLEENFLPKDRFEKDLLELLAY